MHKVVAPCIVMRGKVDAIAARLEKFRKVVSTAEEPLEDPTWKDKMWQSMDSAKQGATTIRGLHAQKYLRPPLLDMEKTAYDMIQLHRLAAFDRQIDTSI